MQCSFQALNSQDVEPRPPATSRVAAIGRTAGSVLAMLMDVPRLNETALSQVSMTPENGDYRYSARSD